MYVKLALRNVKRCARDYLVYCVTVGLTVALVYAFHLLLVSPELQELGTQSTDIIAILTVITLVVVLVAGGLIHYVTSFLLRQRSRELATYLLLGMQKSDIRRMFLGENVLMGCASFLGGIALGSLLFQLLRSVLLNLMEKSYSFRIQFSLEGFLLTLFYFVLLYVFTLWRSGRKLKKARIYDLMYSGNRNQTGRLNHPVIRWAILLLSAVSLGDGLYHLPDVFEPSQASAELMLVILMILAGIFGLHAGAAALLSVISGRLDRVRLRGVNVVLVRQFSGKINSNSVMMGTVAMLLTISLLLFAGGFGLRLSYTAVNEKTSPFDLVITSDYPDITYESALEEVKQAAPELRSLDFTIRSSGTRQIQQMLLPHGYYPNPYYSSSDLCISLSDYNQLRSMLNLPSVQLQEQQYLVHSDVLAFADVLRTSLKGQGTITVQGETLQNAGIEDQFLLQEAIGGFEYLLVLPDRYCDGMPVKMRNLVVKTPDKLPEDLYQALNSTVMQANFPQLYDSYSKWIFMPSYHERATRFSLAATVFALFYLGVVITLICATVLAIQQLSDAPELKRRFALLRRMGAEEKELNRMLRRLLGLYFGMPAVLPVLITGYALWTVLPVEYSRLIRYQLGVSFWLTLALFLLLYLCYFTVAYVGCKRVVRER